MIDGDVVGRDKIVINSGRPRRSGLRLLSPALHERVKHAFVDPDGWPTTRARFGQRRIVVLRGEPGQGRTAMAVRLMMACGNDVIYDLGSDDLERVCDRVDSARADGAHEGAGFLLCPASSGAGLRGATLRHLDATLDRDGGRLVLVVGPEARLADEELQQYAIDLPPAPPLREIVERHVEWRLGARTSSDTPPSEQQITEIVDALADELTSCASAASLAFALSEETAESAGVARIRERMARHDMDAFSTWFDDLGDTWVRSVAIALAVLDGLPHDDVARAADRLHRRLAWFATPAGPTAPTRARRDPFGTSLRGLLERLRAVTRTGWIVHPYGRVPATAVAFQDPSYPREVLAHVWQEHQVHDVLLDWLAELVDEPSDPVRAHVAATIGLFATASFHHVLTALVGPWARSDDPARRAVAAWSLGVAAADPRLAPAVRRLVDGWIADETDPAARATAVRALGLGSTVPDAAAAHARLERVARHASDAVVDAIAWTFADFILADADRFAPAVLTTLLEWSDDPERRDTARWAFLLVAHDLVEDRERRAPDTATVRWPVLLELTVTTPPVRDLLVRNWARALGGDELVEAEQVLAGWAALAEDDREQREAFARLMTVVASTSGRARAVLARAAAQWRHRTASSPLPLTAAAVEAALV